MPPSKPRVPRTMVGAVRQALAAAGLAPEDVATAHLAMIYARAIDGGSTADGPRLLAALTALGCTPSGRKAPPPPGAAPADVPASGGDPGVNPLAAIRAARGA